MKNYLATQHFIQKKQRPNNRAVFFNLKITVALFLTVITIHGVCSNNNAVERCGVQITVVGENQKSFGEVPVVYQLQIKNTGAKSDTYDISVVDNTGSVKNPDGSNPNNNITAGFLLFDSNNNPVEADIVLKPEETILLNLRIVFPAEFKYGSWNIKNIKVISNGCPNVASETRVNTLIPALEIDNGDGTGYVVPTKTKYLFGNLTNLYCTLLSNNQDSSDLKLRNNSI